MRKLSFVITGAAILLLVGIFVWNAEATPLTGSAILHSAANASLVEKAACKRQGPFSRCPLGQQWTCTPQGCGCDPCAQSLQGLTCPAGTHLCYVRCFKILAVRRCPVCFPDGTLCP